MTIVRLESAVNLDFVVEFLRSEFGQIQMLRYVSGSTGQTELLIDHIKALLVPQPLPEVQEAIVKQMKTTREMVLSLAGKADQLVTEGDALLAKARAQMAKLLATDQSKNPKGGRPDKPVKLPSSNFDTNLDALLAVPRKKKK